MSAAAVISASGAAGHVAHVASAMTVRANALFTIALPANPSTGYTWRPLRLPPGFTRYQDTYVTRKVGVMGAGTTMALSFKSAIPGRAVLRLAYERPWERRAAPAKIAVFTIVTTR